MPLNLHHKLDKKKEKGQLRVQTHSRKVTLATVAVDLSKAIYQKVFHATFSVTEC